MSDAGGSTGPRCSKCGTLLDDGRCPACGAAGEASADVLDAPGTPDVPAAPCVAGSPFAEGGPYSAAAGRAAPAVSPFEYVPVRFQFSLGSILMLTTLAAILLSIGTMNWGVGILLSLLAFPALLRTSVTAMWRRSAGYPMTPGETTGLFFTSLIAVLLIGAAFAATFFGTCFVSFLFGASLGDGAAVLGMLIGLFGGLIASVYVLVTSIRFALRAGKEEQVRRMEFLRDRGGCAGESPFPPDFSGSGDP